MTVTYTREVATSRGFGCFLKLLFRWRGSIYKLVWPDLIVFMLIYCSLSLTYRFLLDDYQRRIFEKISIYCESYSSLIPLSFILGFYVSIVVDRWWKQYACIPWPDSTAVYVSANIIGQDDRGRLMRRTIMRYVCLCLTIVFTMISPRVKKRFPTIDHLVEAGLLLENEKGIIEDINKSVPGYSTQWIPIVWATSIVTRARKEGRIRDDFAVKTIIDSLNEFRGNAGLLTSYDWISVPLVYTQVVTLAVYTFFFSCLMGRQFKVTDTDIDMVFPLFTMLQFFFYMGWLKVAETLINPFGEDDDDFEINWVVDRNLTFFFYMGWLKVAESLVNPFGDDDDDFEVNWLIDRNLQVSYLIVDEMHHEHPELIKDQYWDEVLPGELPYTVASEQYRTDPPEHSTARIEVSEEDAEVIGSKLSINVDGDQKSPSNNRRSIRRTTSRTDGRRSSMLSSGSRSTLASSTGHLPRNMSSTSVSTIFRRFFSRDKTNHPDDGKGSTADFGGSASNLATSLNSNRPHVLSDAIPELDENNVTIVSNRGDPHPRPTVLDIFGEKKKSPNEEPSSTDPVSPTSTELMLGPFLGSDQVDDIPNIDDIETPTSLASTNIDDWTDDTFKEGKKMKQTPPIYISRPTGTRFRISSSESQDYDHEANRRLLDESTNTNDSTSNEPVSDTKCN